MNPLVQAPEQCIYQVSEINELIRDMFEAHPMLGSVAVRGELSNYKIYPSGHHYFTMKDADSSIRCVMFKSAASKLRFRPENGMKVIAAGRITVFPRDGQYQLYCTSISPDGIGDLHVAFEQLKTKLSAEGLFDSAHKKALPLYPHRIAIITSSAGAAIRDMLRILGCRYPLAKVLLLPVRVQGAEAPAEICGALKYANRHMLADVIITGRGGGSIEDLWAFNDENVARAIYSSNIPVISAVGHEPDVTISDYVADLRAATPSNAAELVAPDMSELRFRLSGYLSSMAKGINQRLVGKREKLTALSQSRVLLSPLNYYQDKRLLMDFYYKRLISAYRGCLDKENKRYIRCASSLDALSPLKVLGRGYSIVQNMDGNVIKSSEEVNITETVTVRLKEGALLCRVEERIDSIAGQSQL